MTSARSDLHIITHFIKLLGYPYPSNNEKGMCMGLAMTVRQMILSDPNLILPQNINDPMDWENTDSSPDKKSLIQTSTHIEDFLSRLVRLRKIYECNPTSEVLIDLLSHDEKAFLETVEIYQNSPLFRKILSETENLLLSQQDGLKRLPAMLKPVALGDDNIASPYMISGFYSKKELDSYFYTLQALFENVNYPIVITLTSENHAMNVIYLPDHTWLVSNHAEITPVPLEALSTKVLSIFNEPSNIFLASYFSIRESQQQSFISVANALTENKEWHNIHALTASSVTAKSPHNEASLLFLTIEIDQAQRVTEILNITFPSKYIFEQSVTTCINGGSTNSLNALITHPKAPLPSSKHLINAIVKENVEAVALFCKRGMNIHFDCKISLAKIQNLIQTSPADVVNLFLEKNLIEPGYVSHFSLLHLAVLLNCQKIVKILLTNGIDYHREAEGVSALDIAKAMKNQTMIDLLRPELTPGFLKTHSLFLNLKTQKIYIREKSDVPLNLKPKKD